MRNGGFGMGKDGLRAAARLGAAWGFLSLFAALSPAAVNTVGISPTWVEGGHPFTLELAGETDICVSDFTHLEAVPSGGALVLSVLQTRRPGFACTNAASWPYRVEFTAPKLDSGTYPVKVHWRSACEFDPAPCPAAYNLQDAGTLRVTDSAGLPYHISPRSIGAGQASKLLLQGRFGCSDRITEMSVDTARPSIQLHLTVESPAIQCDTIVPGVEFPLPPLRAGVWQVYVLRSPYCPPGTVCPLYKMAPQLAGALEAGVSVTSLRGTGSLTPGSRMAGSRKPGFRNPGFRAPGFQADWQNAPRDAAGRRGPIPRKSAAPSVPEHGNGAAPEQNTQGGKP